MEIERPEADEVGEGVVHLVDALTNEGLAYCLVGFGSETISTLFIYGWLSK